MISSYQKRLATAIIARVLRKEEDSDRAPAWGGPAIIIERGNDPVSDFVLNKDQEPLERRADELRSDLISREPEQLANLTETELQADGESRFFSFSYWGKPVALSCQDYIARDQETGGILPPIHQAMILYYFYSSRGSDQPRKWISFSELADGQFYNAAFQGYTSKKLLQVFGDDYSAFNQANQDTCGEKTSFADGGYRYQVLPKVALQLVHWQGDDEFPPSYKILFEDIVDYHLPTDACAILASMLTGKLIACISKPLDTRERRQS